ncbi:MAG: hypothetical protein J0L87_06770 [Bacteroidetes bacterium]|nr:hypothetical protein [Bacteroidota bacterium]
MLKKHTFWFKGAILFQFITGAFHLLSFLNTPVPKNESEKQLFELMTNYKFDLGAGFHQSMDNLMTSFSIAFALLLFFSATLNIFLLQSKLPIGVLKGAILINFFIYLICFITMGMLTFLPPIICTGLIALSLLLSYFLLPKKNAAH